METEMNRSENNIVVFRGIVVKINLWTGPGSRIPPIPPSEKVVIRRI
jgi:hypothetical protein